MRIDRLLAITIMMLNRERVTAKELADKFEVSLRTIYRDLDALNLAGIPVVSYPGNQGGYGIMENYRLDRSLLTNDDIIAILSTLRGVNQTLENRNISDALEKIQSLVSRHKSNEALLSAEQVMIDMQPWGESPVLKNKLKTIHDQISAGRLLEFDYTKTNGEVTKREVEPMTLLYKSYAWYLFAYCLLRDDYRFFRLTRMKNLNPLKKGFTRREKSYRDCISADFTKDKMITLVLKFSKYVRQFIEDSFEESEIEPLEDGSILVRTEAPENEWIYGWILSYSDQVEVLEPDYLREIIIKKAEKIQKKYQT